MSIVDLSRCVGSLRRLDVTALVNWILFLWSPSRRTDQISITVLES